MKRKKETIEIEIAFNRQQEKLHYKDVDCQAPNRRVLASHCHEKLYTLGTDVDRRRGMDRGGGDNEDRKRISPIRDTQTQDVFIR